MMITETKGSVNGELEAGAYYMHDPRRGRESLGHWRRLLSTAETEEAVSDDK